MQIYFIAVLVLFYREVNTDSEDWQFNLCKSVRKMILLLG